MIHNSHSVDGVQRNLDPDEARMDSRLGLVLGVHFDVASVVNHVRIAVFGAVHLPAEVY